MSYFHINICEGSNSEHKFFNFFTHRGIVDFKYCVTI